MIHSFKEDLAKEFEMKDMGLLHYFLGLEIWQGDGKFFVSQGKYAREILEKFHMQGCKPIDRGSGCHFLSTVGGFAHVFS